MGRIRIDLEGKHKNLVETGEQGKEIEEGTIEEAKESRRIYDSLDMDIDEDDKAAIEKGGESVKKAFGERNAEESQEIREKTSETSDEIKQVSQEELEKTKSNREKLEQMERVSETGRENIKETGEQMEESAEYYEGSSEQADETQKEINDDLERLSKILEETWE